MLQSKGRRAGMVLVALGLVWGFGAQATPPASPPPGVAGTAPLVPRAKSTGFSAIEQRYVYAPPDKGHIEIPLQVGGGAQNELLVMEPIMCQPEARAKVTIDYDKAANTVVVTGDFHKALPYRASLTRPDDASTPYNQFPLSVQDGKWQLWFVGQLFSFNTTFYYDAATLQLIGNEAEFPAGPPPNSIPVPVPTLHMLCSPMFEGDVHGNAHVQYTLRYDQMLDGLGAGGTYFAFVPYNLCKPDEYGPYYVNGGVSPARAMSFDDVLQSIWDGYGMAMSSSLEPDPKPAYLNSRDNPMVGWGGGYPAKLPRGITANPISGTFEPLGTCQTRVAPKLPPGLFNICGAP